MKPGAKPKGQVTIVWSPQFAYCIGLLTADGCLQKDGRHIDLTSKDWEQVATFKKCLGLKVKIGTKRSGIGNEYWRIQFSDVLFYRFLISIGVTPAKSKTIKSVEVPDKYFADFLRGYFDVDGCSYSFYDSLFPKSYRFYISFMSASPKFIDWLRDRLQTLTGVKGHLSRSLGKSYLQLKYAKKEAIILFGYMYGTRDTPALKRKYLKIRRTMRIINRRRGGEIGKHATFRS